MRPHRRQPTRLPCPWDSPGKNTGVGCHVLLQCMKGKSESEVTQSCPTLSDLMDCSLPGSSTHWTFQPRILEWVAIPFFRGSSWPRDWTQVSWIAGRFFVCLYSKGKTDTYDFLSLAWRIPWMEEPGRLQSMGSLSVGHDWSTSLSLFTFMHWRRQWQPTPVYLPGESQGRGNLVGCRLWGRTESDMTEVT